MSILSSTKTGRKGIKIDEKILNSYGYNNYSVIKYNTKIHTIHFAKMINLFGVKRIMIKVNTE
jgi:hypothetical protein